MKAIHWRIKKIEQLNKRVNQTPDADANANDNPCPPGYHHFKRRIFSLKNTSKTDPAFKGRKRRLPLLTSLLADPGHIMATGTWTTFVCEHSLQLVVSAVVRTSIWNRKSKFFTLFPLQAYFEDCWWPLQTIWIQMRPHKTWGLIWDPNCLTLRL